MKKKHLSPKRLTIRSVVHSDPKLHAHPVHGVLAAPSYEGAILCFYYDTDIQEDTVDISFNEDKHTFQPNDHSTRIEELRFARRVHTQLILDRQLAKDFLQLLSDFIDLLEKTWEEDTNLVEQ